mgnify:CR=1 FL=1
MFQGKDFLQNKRSVRSLGEFHEHVEHLKFTYFNNSTLWYRGIADKAYLLIPSIYRSGKYTLEIENLMRQEFRDHAKGLTNYTGLQQFDWLFMMQHYGLKTRLLDWTQGYLIALYFATQLGVRDNRFSDPAVWVINPLELNILSQGEGRIIRTEFDMEVFDDSQLALGYLELNAEFVSSIDWPVAISSSYTNQRVMRQQGRFTIHGTKQTEIVSLYRNSKIYNVARINIERKFVKQIQTDLLNAGISKSVLFPDLSALSEEINERYLG